MKASHLACKGCGAGYPLEALFACDRCFGPLEVRFDESEPVARASVEAGPRTLWRFADFLPVAPPERGLPVGCSPLIRADRLAAELGLECELYIKTETSNPTHSFKDRVVAVAAAKAVEAGVVIRALPKTPWIRASCGYWTSDEDLDRLVAALS
jgi:threonine synthase